jgi:transcriptional regulator with PAS, ATPase and Fis domain
MDLYNKISKWHSTCLDGIMKIIKFRINLFRVILFILSLFSIIPISILIYQSISNLNTSKDLSNQTIETTIKGQTTQVYKSYAQNLARRVSDFLYSCESDLMDLSVLPRTPLSYKLFSQNNKRWVNHIGKNLTLYKEIALIDENGNERIKIINDEIAPAYLLKNVNEKKNTRYLSETYFQDTKQQTGNIYVTHLTSWYISRHEQLEQNKTLDGVIRFCKKIKDDNGNFKGIIMIALDFIHMLDFVDYRLMDKESLKDRYKMGSYNYIIDDEGWIIAHQKLWDIRGLNKEGVLVEKLKENTPKWKYDAGIMPINLFSMDWRLRDIYTNEPMSSVIERVRNGETAITTMKSMGIYTETEGIIRTRTYAPIFYSTGSYSKYGIFGAVSVGTSLKKFMDKSQSLAEQLESINNNSKIKMIYIAIIICLCVVVSSLYIARRIAKPLSDLGLALSKIEKADYSVENIESPIKEIETLSCGVVNLAKALEEKDKKINKTVKELESVNSKLAEAKKELSAYWRHEYDVESDAVLEEKIKTYEKEYPCLVEIRKEKLIGNSPQFLRVLRQIVPLSQMNLSTWICGESGVGKTALAFVIHSLGPRSQKPFMVFEASEFSASDQMIVMGKLFGYGAGHGINGIDKNGQPGIIEACNGGTLLVDDVDALPLETQAQILRVVDGLSFHPAAGKSKEIQSDVRFLFASHINLEQKVKEGTFRKDLFRRIGGSFNKIEIPPLRERRSDIHIIAEYFLNKLNTKHGLSLKYSQAAQNILFEHDYKDGNIGEMKILVEVSYQNARMENSEVITEKFFPSIQKLKNRLPQDNYAIDKQWFSKDELNKLVELRNNSFRIDVSEEILGFKKGSHALSHHLKGICFKALFKSGFNIEKAVQIISDGTNEKLNSIIRQKIDGYIVNIREKGNSENESSLRKNLPKEYHQYLAEAIEYYQKLI